MEKNKYRRVGRCLSCNELINGQLLDEKETKTLDVYRYTENAFWKIEAAVPSLHNCSNGGVGVVVFAGVVVNQQAG
jgi:hypothetical protein